MTRLRGFYRGEVRGGFHDLSRSLLAERAGFGRNVQGGRGGQHIIVTNLNNSGAGSLREAIETDGPRYITFNVSGTITLATRIQVYDRVSDHCTIDARDSGIVIAGNGLVFGHSTLGCNNIIVAGLEFGDIENPDSDCLEFTKCNGIWIHRCTLVDDEVTEPDPEESDEAVGITTGCDDITVSWCKFVGDHSMIVGLPSVEAEDGKNHITLHHNYFYHCGSRMPRASRTSVVHAYNNLFEEWEGGYAVGLEGVEGSDTTTALLENNIFHAGAVTKAAVYPSFDPPWAVRKAGNLLENSATLVETDPEDVPDITAYTYSLDSTTGLRAAVEAGAGA